MPCLHRFHEELLPANKKQFLFIGTFNPAWDVQRGDNPDYFYSRDTNLFWCVLPHAFNQNCLVDKNRKEKLKFCIDNRIGLTDLIYCLPNANEEDKDVRDYLTKGFKDETFEVRDEAGYKLEIEFFTGQIQHYIARNKNHLKGVFFTRATKTGIPRIWEQWLRVRDVCNQYGVYNATLPSPSVRGGGIRSKILTWRQAINH